MRDTISSRRFIALNRFPSLLPYHLFYYFTPKFTFCQTVSLHLPVSTREASVTTSIQQSKAVSFFNNFSEKPNLPAVPAVPKCVSRCTRFCKGKVIRASTANGSFPATSATARPFFRFWNFLLTEILLLQPHLHLSRNPGYKWIQSLFFLLQNEVPSLIDNPFVCFQFLCRPSYMINQKLSRSCRSLDTGMWNHIQHRIVSFMTDSGIIGSGNCAQFAAKS